MKVGILAFGIAKEIVGGPTTEITLNGEPTVQNLRYELEQTYPQLKQLKSFLIAVNNSYATGDHLLNKTDEIAIIPPVSGG